jgi:hypothetical protein
LSMEAKCRSVRPWRIDLGAVPSTPREARSRHFLYTDLNGQKTAHVANSARQSQSRAQPKSEKFRKSHDEIDRRRPKSLFGLPGFTSRSCCRIRRSARGHFDLRIGIRGSITRQREDFAVSVQRRC